MNLRSIVVVAVVALPVTACGSQESVIDEGNWVGTITTEGNVTTVVNESGSVWGGTATLVEEASIGVEAGADEYMLGGVSGIAAHEDRVYVVDSQVPAVRVYDLGGVYLRNLGGRGQGPASTSPLKALASRATAQSSFATYREAVCSARRGGWARRGRFLFPPGSSLLQPQHPDVGFLIDVNEVCAEVVGG